MAECDSEVAEQLTEAPGGSVTEKVAEDCTTDEKREEGGSEVTKDTLSIYKKLAQINGTINRMTRDGLVAELGKLGLSTRGNKEVLVKRLKSYYKRIKLSQTDQGKAKPFKYVIVIDYECTCEANSQEYLNEIIEFPAVLLSVEQCKKVGEFRTFVKPKLNPTLSDFCTDLTGIRQREVDEGLEFPEALRLFEAWKDDVVGHSKTLIATDGPWDLSRFMFNNCLINDVQYPAWARRWCNLRKTFGNFYGVRRCGIKRMLELLGLQYSGRLHSGIDDSRNIATIALRLQEDGVEWTDNESLSSDQRRQLREKGLHWKPSSSAAVDSDEEEDEGE